MNDRPFQIASYSLSDVGCIRQLNEDRSFTDPDSGVWVVADGMGGHDAGDVASEAIVNGLMGLPRHVSAMALDEDFRDRIFRANSKIRNISEERGNVVIGSTLVALLVFGEAYRCLWSGDSRAYLLRGHTLTQITRDHTELQELLDRGMLTPEEAENYPRRNVITHAIGVNDYVYLDIADGKILQGDTFLLCSDGLTGHVSNQEIGEIMAGRRSKEICEQLVSLALERGGTDNVTVSAVQFHTSKATIPVHSAYQVADLDPFQ
jgi:protein phosphatase